MWLLVQYFHLYNEKKYYWLCKKFQTFIISMCFVKWSSKLLLGTDAQPCQITYFKVRSVTPTPMHLSPPPQGILIMFTWNVNYKFASPNII
jgi:hypothetical protein